MINKVQSFHTTDGVIHATIDAAKTHELQSFISKGDLPTGPSAQQIAEFLIANDEKVIDLLSTKASSRPAARKVNGGKKKPKAVVAQAAPPEPSLI
jgi:hypothetical protein